MNRLIEKLIAGGKRVYRWLQEHEHLRPVLRFLRRHWPETLAVVSLVALIGAVNPPELIHAFGRASWRPIALMFPVVLLSYVCRGMAWWFTLRCIGEPITIRRCLSIEFAGQVMVFLPLGDLARVAMVRGTQHDVDAGPITGTIAFQELTFMMLLGLGVLPRVFSEPGVAALAVIMVLIHVGIFLILSWRPVYDWALRMVERIRILRRFDKQLRELRPAFMELWDVRAAAPVFALQALAAVLNFILFWLALQAMGATKLSLAGSAYVLGLSYIVAGMSLVPGGLGTFEGVVTILLISNGIPAAIGAAASLLYRGFNDVVVALVGVPFGIRVRRALQQADSAKDTGRRRRRPAARGRRRRGSARAAADASRTKPESSAPRQ